MKHDADVIVIGGGHAGAEAADAAARRGARTMLITPDPARIGEMSCNPAIGGLGKGHLVREVDALDGIMGRAADAAGIQYRLLNRRKGPAVRGPRVQCDRKLYKAAVQSALGLRPRLQIVAGMVVDLIVFRQRVEGVILADGSRLTSEAVVLTTGTFLRGVIHIGDQRIDGGRMGESPSVWLAERIEALDLPMGRLKTGTPPRLDGRTIRWDETETQPGDECPEMMSLLSERPAVRQVPCHITRTTGSTHERIRENLSRSALYGGGINGVGPRYCPSIEDKVVRFADKDSHQVFLEPEGLDDHTVYPNGISTSLPEDVQRSFVRTLPGLADVEILQPGYAIEYDYVDPRALSPDLQLAAMPGLYLAGQINGTTGYEEAAGQGLIAGSNAAAAVLNLEPLSVDRADGYLGVMIDDLVLQGVTEPYRMFTSRAEYRLSLRIDNADQRLTETGRRLGLVGNERWDAFQSKIERLEAARTALSTISLTSDQARRAGFTVARDGGRRDGFDLLARPDVTFDALRALAPSLDQVDAAASAQMEIEAKYARYLDRQARDAKQLKEEDATPLAPDVDYSSVPGLSAELVDKLSKARPRSVGAASRIEGMTPAALTLLLIEARRSKSQGASAA